eukprot:CAMPEP_0197022524 /NCGR_PEP_ID=MMETSP1384-20130603/3370_1 /TAXON_ID=29189 /ORGANISM="Ammonia sp." /LENGTH=698 /DNA_ID=CAMNT_0042450581 /DNA_START=38 /DNA_END=2134 /DNA_ORIENTATION=+
MTESYVAATQEVFADLITKPKLTEKLLNRPPFRFIHDIVTNTLKSTGFPEGLFQGDELNGKLIKGKQDKIDWLSKLIECIESVTKQSLNVNPNKVVAGLEAEYTNEMLQAFANVATQVANGQLSMPDILSGLNPTQTDEPPDVPNDTANDNDNNPNNSETPATDNQPSQSPPEPQPPTQPPEPNKPTKASASPSPHPSRPASARSRPSSGRRSRYSSSSTTVNTAVNENSANTPAWIIETQQTLGALIERPRLLEKLLKRPPFRFLHDIIKSLIEATGYPLALLDAEKDIKQADIKDVKFKYQFVVKLTLIVSATLNEDLSSIDPKNVIAGKKPEDTNVLLTKLAKAATTYNAANVDDIKKRIQTLQEAHKRQKQQQQQQQAAQKKPTKTKTPRTQRADSKKQSNGGRHSARPVMPKLALDQLQSGNDAQKTDGSQIPQASHSKAPVAEQQAETFQVIQKLQRPRTARRAPPKLAPNVMDGESKEKEIETNVIIMDQNENSQHTTLDQEVMEIEDLDDGAQGLGFIRNDDDVDVMNLADETHASMDGVAMAEDDGDHGKLVRDILDAQSGIKLESTRLGTHRKDSAKSTERMENMKEMIQKLCQTCLPLGKCMDLVFQDVEAINSELLKWKQEIKQNQSRLTLEKENTSKALHPLQKQLDQIKRQIAAQQQLILQKKAVLLKNEENINDIIHKRLLNE